MPGDPTPPQRMVAELFEHAPCGYLATLPDGTIVQVNDTFVAMSGFARDWLLAGRRFAELLTVPGKIYFDTHIGPLLEMQGFVREIAFDLVRSDGHCLPVIVHALRKRLSAGTGDAASAASAASAAPAEPPLALVTVFDATDRRQYEKELLLARRRAEEASGAERTARRQAEEAARAKDEFLAMVSHELRTPLNAIVGWAQMLQADPAIADEQREGLAVIERNAQVQAELINDLLDMSRLITGKMRLNVQDVRLADVVEAALDTARPAADAKGVRLEKVLAPAVVVAGDPGRLQQVFWNLLNNAVKFTPKGGFIRVVMQQVNSHVEVAVADSGQGMPPEFIAHAFDRFRQSDSGETRRTGGLGLGLSIVKSLVEMHGGSVSAASDGPGKGSTFRVNLPVAPVHPPGAGEERVSPHASALAAGGAGAAPGVSLRGVKVLVVDDEPDAREVLRRLLAAAGADVIAAGSAAEALGRLERDRPNVLVSDIGMPGVDGYELIRRVRMMGEGAGAVRAVALTAFARLEDRAQAMLAGFQMHLAKPVDGTELIVTVATLAKK